MSLEAQDRPLDMVVDPVRRGGMAQKEPGSTHGPRILSSYQFLWLYEGQVRWQCDGQWYELSPGHLLLIRKGMNDYFEWDRKARTRHAYIHFHMQVQDQRLPPQDEWPVALEPHVARPIVSVLETCMECLAQDHPLTRAVAIDSLRTAVAMLSMGGVQSLGTELHEELHPAMKRLLIQIINDIESGRPNRSLDGMARCAGVSVSHMHRLCEALFGRSPQQMQRQVRLDYAAELLEHTNAAVQAVADQSGFACPFHFSKTFNKAFGMSPRAYRNQVLMDQYHRDTPLIETVRRLIRLNTPRK